MPNNQHKNYELPPEQFSMSTIKGIGKIGKDDVKDLQAVIGILPLRNKALIDAIDRMARVEATLSSKILTPDQRFKLAVTDVFVEKAQLVLTRRSNQLFTAGIVSIFVAFIILVITYFLARGISTITTDEISTNALILRIFQSIALSAYIFVAIKYLISLARSFLHEASTLRDRRHALRFGRLYSYLKKGEVNLDDLQKSFQWNIVSNSSFLDINSSAITETLMHKFAEVGTAIANSPTEALKVLADKAPTEVKSKKK